jgi:PAS domain S-box-containing protein
VELKNNQSATIEVYSRATCIDGRWIIIGVSRDVSDRKNAEMRAVYLQQMFSALSLTNEAVLRAKSVQTLYRNACTAAVSCELFTIATVLEPGESGWFNALANAGKNRLELEHIQVSSDPNHPRGKGLVGECYRHRRPAISNDYLSDPRLAAWHDVAAAQGTQSAAALPLFRRSDCVAVFVLYAADKNAFDDEIMTILESMAENISFGLNNFANAQDQAQVSALLKENEERFRSLTHLSSDFYWEQDAALRFTQYEGRVVGESNKRAAERLIGKHLWELPGVKPDSYSWRQLRQMLKDRQQFREFEISFTNDENKHYHFSLSGVPFFDCQQKFKGYRGIARDISEKKRIDLRIKHLATHDTLTGLPNRTMFSELLQQAIRVALRYKDQGFAVLFIDLDRFKTVNDTYGHHIGDRLLTEVASRLKTPLRGSDIVARLGGDEFVILLQKANTQ